MSDKVKQMSGADRSNGYMEALGRTAVAVAAAHVHFGLMVYGYAPWMDKVVFFCIFFCFFFLSPLFLFSKDGLGWLLTYPYTNLPHLFNVNACTFQKTDGGVAASYEWYTCYLIEETLSLDNLFAFYLVFKFFKVKKRVLSTACLPPACRLRLSVVLDEHEDALFATSIWLYGPWCCYSLMAVYHASVSVFLKFQFYYQPSLSCFAGAVRVAKPSVAVGYYWRSCYASNYGGRRCIDS